MSPVGLEDKLVMNNQPVEVIDVGILSDNNQLQKHIEPREEKLCGSVIIRTLGH